ncbi:MULTISPECIES: TetR/AcrR family transcriptional regulator [unclassified Yoonia]|uniref:TetR/AcrR family transcriptional regulator n=1 Tax=unclassified Yoonia TaxID=2629118 RepID=UPI002B003CAC|nr:MULTISPECIES: TetR/AcrR family transcriptional regulator [unclassified Yoonia]
MIMTTEQTPKTTPRPGRPRRADEGDVTLRILKAATDLFLKDGVAATSCEAVVAKARVGKASLYARYAGKDALFKAVVQHVVDSGAFNMDAPVPSGGSPRDRLAIAGKAVLMQAISPVPLALMRLFLTEARRFPDLIADVDGMARSRVTDIVARAVSADQTEAGPSDRALAIAECFLNLTFAPLMLAALTGHGHAISGPAIDSRIAFALDTLDRNGLLQKLR